jgi:hypothetical protein
MKGDFTRFTHDPAQHYTGVLKQQGRVDLDADWNEQLAIQQYLDRTEATDVIGPSGAPVSGGGFQVVAASTAGDDLDISAGRIYVDGILCELAEGVKYTEQADYPDPAALGPADGRTDLVYLDVWERHITAIEDPHIREVALGGPDTATRVQTVWQVKVLKGVGNVTCADALGSWPPAPSGARLTTGVVSTPSSQPLCSLSPAGGYRGLENQLYRVEIHSGSDAGTPTYKWSRDNGSVVFAVEEFKGGQPTTFVKVKSLGRDQVQALRVGDWVEVLDDDTELTEKPGTLAQVADVNEAERTLTLSKTISGYDLDKHPKVRRWDQPSDALKVTAATVDLENGIQIQFSGSNYKSGDYWVFAARTATGDVETLTKAPPHGLTHHYCRLGLVTWKKSGSNWQATIHDCRPKFPPLTGLTSLYYVGGDGQEAMPGSELPQLLEVRAASGGWVIEGATVRFTAAGSGRLAKVKGGTAASAVNTLDVTTGEDGIAGCAWLLEAAVAKPSQQVTATLLDADGNPVRDENGKLVHVIHFSANLSIAGQVAYESKKCLLDAPTVKDALDQLCQNVALYYVGGDGQETLPGEWLPQPLQVRAANGGFPLEKASVVFKVIEGQGKLVEGETCSGLGTLATFDEITVDTDKDGLASCCWKLDTKNPSQRVGAGLKGAKDPLIYFNANLSRADLVEYTPPVGCTVLAGAKTVKDALDAVCKLDQTTEEGVHIRKVLVKNKKGKDVVLKNDGQVLASVLVHGIRVVCSEPVAPATVDDKPVCFVTLDLPYPVTGPDKDFWSSGPIGFQSIRLAATVKAEEQTILWKPANDTSAWLGKMFERLNMSKVLAHLTIKGNFIWARDDPSRYLDGDDFGEPDGSHTGVRLPSGDGRRGGDFEMWFWLVSQPAAKVEITGIYVGTVHVVAGNNVLATVKLSEAAPPGGMEIVIVGAGSTLDMPETVFVPAGEQEVTFEIETRTVSEETKVTLEAHLGDSVHRRSVTVSPGG